jgi:hypothetical protein
MLEYKVTGDVKAITDHLSRMARDQIPFATAKALTMTAKAVQREIDAEIKRVFDRPTPYTQRATFVRTATKQRLFAEVKLKDQAFKGNPAVRYLEAQVEGGRRKHKGFEKLLIRAGVMPAGWYAVPGKGAPLDAYGNISGGTITRILSQLKASRDPLANETARSKGRNRRRVKARYFAVMPGRERTKHLKAGVYERVGRSIKPVLIYVQRAPKYRRRLQFYRIADQVARMRFPIEFARAAREAISTARPAGRMAA